jgi:signal transduction histidine kinase
MNTSITRFDIQIESDIVHIRRVARVLAQALGFDSLAQARIGTAVSEVTRHTFQYAQGGSIEFLIAPSGLSSFFQVEISDHGPDRTNLSDMLEGPHTAPSGLELGILSAKRLCDQFYIKPASPGPGTVVTLGILRPMSAPKITPALLESLADTLAELRSQSPLEDQRVNNKELLATLDFIKDREDEVTRLNSELIKTNEGVLALYDEVERKNERLQQSEMNLEERNQQLKIFASAVAHDLKAPLRGIGGYAQELKLEHSAGLSKRAVFCLSQILAANSKLDQLITDLLIFAKLDAATPMLTEVRVPSLVTAILEDRSLAIAQQHAEVVVDIPFATERTWETGLIQVVSNLVDNAMKFSRNSSPPRVSIRTQHLAKAWRLIVSDNGIGFDMHDFNRMLKLFSRLQTVVEYEGTGAGLAIVKNVVDKLGGRLWAESQLGQGATFYVELPRLNAAMDVYEDKTVKQKSSKLKSVLNAQEAI